MLQLPPALLPLRALHNPLAQGKALLLGPSMTLLRWPKGEPVPELGGRVLARQVVLHQPDQVDALRRLLFAKGAIERCDAAKALPRSVVLEVYSYQQANQLLYVAEHLSAELRANITERGLAASLHQLIAVAYGKSPEVQRKRWNAYLNGGALAARAIF